jgi:hypothetical protein
MAYELARGNPLAAELRRVALEQVERIDAELQRFPDDARGSVHEMRRRIKELRALFRLSREAIGDESYALANTMFRDMARLISVSRDRDATLQLLARIRPELSSVAGADAYRSVRRAVRRRAVTDDADTVTNTIAAELQRARLMIEGWSFSSHDDFSLIGPGLERTYRRGRKALRGASASHSPDDLHEMRKHVKDQMFQLQLLKNVAPAFLKPQRDLLTQLGKTLGEHHDLHTLELRIGQVPFRTRGRRESIASSLRERMIRLEAEAFRLGRFAYAESPSAWVARVRSYWESEAG